MRCDGGDSETLLAEFTRQGVNIKSLAANLQREGTAAFARSWNDLLSRITAKSAVLTQDSQD
jgi:transaldolase